MPVSTDFNKVIIPAVKEQMTNEPVPEKQATHNIPKPTVIKQTDPKKKILSQEEKNWKENRVRDQTIKKSSGKKKISMSKIYTALSIVITIGICGYFAYTFYIHSEINKDELIQSEIPESIPDETINSMSSTEISISENVSTSSQNKPHETKVLKAPEESDIKIANKKEVIAKKEPIQKSDISLSNESMAKTPSGIIISYVSNSTEEMAVSNVKSLEEKGFKANYYFMPDKSKSSPALFKVYLGPYKDESAAMSDFRKIVELNDKAFILRLD